MRLRRRTRRWLKRTFVIVIPFLLGLLFFYTGPTFTTYIPTQESMTEEKEQRYTELIVDSEDLLSTEGFTKIIVEPIPNKGIVLRANCTGIPIAMSNLKAFSIQRGVENVLDIRPNYHDLTYDLITHYNSTVLMAKISRMKNNFYYADLVIQEANGNILHLDSRPSDALGIASRFRAPMYVNDKLLKGQGVQIC